MGLGGGMVLDVGRVQLQVGTFLHDDVRDLPAGRPVLDSLLEVPEQLRVEHHHLRQVAEHDLY